MLGTRGRLVVAAVVIGAGLAATGGSGASEAAFDCADHDADGPAGFACEVVDDGVAGAAFAITAQVIGDATPELVVSSFGPLVTGSIPLPAGEVALYQHDAHAGGFVRHEVISNGDGFGGDGIKFPNEVNATDVDGDGDVDLVVPAGFFVCAFEATPCGSLTWWEQDQTTARGWVRHDVVKPGAPLFFHRVEVVDVTGDGVLDIVTVGETLVSAQAQVYVGLDHDDDQRVDEFSPVPVELGPFGGSLPRVADVDDDGDLDLASAQFFQPGGSAAWLERVTAPGGPAWPAAWVNHTMTNDAGPSIQLAPVEGVGWVLSNHTDTTTFPHHPESGVYLLTPGDDPRLPWSARRISTGMVSRPSRLPAIQGAAGVFGSGDIDGDGDHDLAVAGDGDPRLFWLENPGNTDGPWHTHVLATGMGQGGGGHVADVDRDGCAEVLFTSYEERVVTLWQHPSCPPTA